MFKCMKFLIVFLCFILNEGIADEILTWQDCVKEAKKNHPDLISATEKLNQAKANKTIADSSLFPQINSDLSQNRTTHSYGVNAKQLVFDGFKVFHDMSQAEKKIESTKLNYEVISSNVRLKLRTAFVRLLKTQELLNITENIAKRRKQNVELVKLRYKAGREHKGSLLTAQANLAQAEFEVTQAKRNINLNQRRLIKELGREKLQASIRVKGDFNIKYSNQPSPNFENLTKNNPSLKTIIAEKEAAEFSLKSAHANFFPEVHANISVRGTGSSWLYNNNELSMSVGLSFPIFDGGQRSAKVTRNKAVFDQTKADEKSRKNSVILTLEETWAKLQDAIDKVNVKKKFLAAAEERAKITQVQYSNGLVSFDNWTIIEDDLVGVRKSFLEAQTNALIAEANWIQAKGETLSY